MDGALLMAGQNVLEIAPVKRVVDREHCPAWIAEDVFYFFEDQTPEQGFCARYLFAELNRWNTVLFLHFGHFNTHFLSSSHFPTGIENNYSKIEKPSRPDTVRFPCLWGERVRFAVPPNFIGASRSADLSQSQRMWTVTR
jgi:hypothetical protein